MFLPGFSAVRLAEAIMLPIDSSSATIRLGAMVRRGGKLTLLGLRALGLGVEQPIVFEGVVGVWGVSGRRGCDAIGPESRITISRESGVYC
jgi:hypothetical protein